ncbi:hypothetical protein CUMW_107250 [Citrus unshiu]|uniref:Uncharacterized protein n=1 Tax=Citrus unshiu TaxID=55188 RepID=A0A2H5P612_CITUN|nr:hypothetical protein CUMW_107250 [Citrus unshiu]
MTSATPTSATPTATAVTMEPPAVTWKGRFPAGEILLLEH